MSFHNHDTEDYNKKYDPAGRKAAELAAKPQDEETVKTLMQLVRYGWDAAAEKILNYCINNKVTQQFSDMIMEMLDEKNKNQFVWENFESKLPITQRTYSEQEENEQQKAINWAAKIIDWQKLEIQRLKGLIELMFADSEIIKGSWQTFKNENNL